MSSKALASLRPGWLAAVCAALLVLALLLNAYFTDRATAPASAGPDGEIVRLPGAPDVRAQLAGRPERPTVVLLHGFTLSTADWSRVASFLAPHYRVVSLDLIGHGGSEKPREGFGPVDQAEAIWAALDWLQIRCPLLAGHSYGGNVAGAMAEARPAAVRGLMVLGSGAHWSQIKLPLTARASTWPVVGELIYQTIPDGVVEDNLKHAFALGTDVPEEFVDAFRSMTYAAYRGSMHGLREYLKAEPMEDRLRADGVPVMAVAGTADEIVDPAALESWGRIPGSEIRPVSGGSHMLTWEEPRWLSNQIRRLDDRLDRECQRGSP